MFSAFKIWNACIERRFSLKSVYLVWRRSASSSAFLPLASISSSELGDSILMLKKNGSSHNTQTDVMRRYILMAKSCSLGSSALGIIMMPTLSSLFWETASEKPTTMLFIVIANAFLGLLTFTPLLLHFLVKRFVVDVYYNKSTSIFTTVHYNFFLSKRALRFHPEEVVDAAIAPESKKLWIPLATCFVKGHPLLLSLDVSQYNDSKAFELLTRNVNIPMGSD